MLDEDEAFARADEEPLGEVVGLGEVEPDGDGLGEADPLEVGLAAVGEVARHWVEMPEHSSTWRNRSSAVCPTMPTTFSAPWPGHRHGEVLAALLLHDGAAEPGAVDALVHDVPGLGHLRPGCGVA